MGDTSFDLQLRLFAIFNFVFVAPGCINQMQPFFLKNRDLFETREKKVRMKRQLEIFDKDKLLTNPSLVQNLSLACIHRRTGLVGNSVLDYLRDCVLLLLVLHRRIPRRGADFRAHLPPDDL